MKLVRFFLLIIAFVLSGSLKRLEAQTSNNPIITLQENGVGSLVFPGGGTFASTGVPAPDPGPGGLFNALTFNLLGPPGLVAGDLLINEFGGSTLSDILRFNPAGSAPGYPASAVLYSLPGGGELADTGFPTLRYATTFTTSENAAGMVTYTPTASQPGFIPGFGVTYVVTSSPIPEPTTVLFGAALIGVTALRRSRTVRQ
jgi:hypothetical protein